MLPSTIFSEICPYILQNKNTKDIQQINGIYEQIQKKNTITTKYETKHTKNYNKLRLVEKTILLKN